LVTAEQVGQVFEGYLLRLQTTTAIHIDASIINYRVGVFVVSIAPEMIFAHVEELCAELVDLREGAELCHHAETIKRRKVNVDGSLW
jgi:hypothetical protein